MNGGVGRETDGDPGGAAKRELRARVLAERRAMPDRDRDAAGSAIRDSLPDLPELTTGGTVALYYSVGTEPNTRKLLAALWKHGAYVLLPVMLADGDLDWAGYDGPDSLAPAAHGLLEPTGQRYGTDAVRRAAAVICPALAVDRSGTRLGRGAGCYDRALARVGPQTLTLAVTYDAELLDAGALPTEAHDRPVRGVITPGGGALRF